MGGVGIFTIVIIAASCIFSVGITVVAIVLIRRMVAPNRAVLEGGTPGEAKILKVWQTGTYINNQPQVGLHLEVTIPGRSPYETEIKMVIPMINIPQFQPGAVFPVKVDPNNPNKVVLDVYG